MDLTIYDISHATATELEEWQRQFMPERDLKYPGHSAHTGTLPGNAPGNNCRRCIELRDLLLELLVKT